MLAETQGRLRYTALALVLMALAVSCRGTPRRVLQDSDYPGELRAPAELGADLLWQQRVTARWGDSDQRGFDAAVQKQGDVLTVIGMSPLGQPGFVLIQRTGSIDFQNHTDMDLPFPPRFVLLDVQRTFFPWLGAAAQSDGERQAEVGGERVVEQWRDGKLRERRFARLDGQPAGDIVVHYEWDGTDPSWRAPRRTVLHNGWFGYQMIVETHAEAVLPPAAQ